MKIEFEIMDDKGNKVVSKEVTIFAIGDLGTEKGVRKEVGGIFTPSGSSQDTNNAIQICGFTEAFDLWGCSRYVIPSYNHLEKVYDQYGKVKMEHVKDIQLQFSMEIVPAHEKISYSAPLLKTCWGCFNTPCTCEMKVKKDNPYVVKRAQDLFLDKTKSGEVYEDGD